MDVITGDGILATIHGGVAWAIIKYEGSCECNAYCKDGVHCDVCYSGPGVTPEVAIRIARQDNRIMRPPTRIVRVERAYEAPRPGSQHFDHWTRLHPGESLDDLIPWLVFWEVVEQS